MKFLSAPKKKSPEPLDAPDILAEGFSHTSTRLQLTLKTHRSKCEHMQRAGRKLWYCRSPETRPRHWNKSLQAQVGLMWCLGPMLTSAEEWVIPTASRNARDPKHCRWQPPTAWVLFSVTQDSRWSNAHEWHCLLPIWEVSLCPSLCLQSFGNPDTYLAFLFPILLTLTAPRAIPVSQVQKGWKTSHEQCEKSSGKGQFLTILQKCVQNFF